MRCSRTKAPSLHRRYPASPVLGNGNLKKDPCGHVKKDPPVSSVCCQLLTSFLELIGRANVRFRTVVPSRTLVLVMPGRGTLARRNGRLGRTVWSTTTNRSGRSVERPLECRGRLVWRTRRRVGRSVSVAAPGEPGGGAIARADHVRMGVDARPRANPPLRSARPGQTGALGCGRTSQGLIEILRMNVVPVSVIDDDRCGGTVTPPVDTAHGPAAAVRLAKPKASRVPVSHHFPRVFPAQLCTVT